MAPRQPGPVRGIFMLMDTLLLKRLGKYAV
jgi:hypothetical protein